MKAWLNNQHGQAAAETALVLPLLLFLLLGLFVVGFWFNAQFVVTAAAREGVRQLALNGSCTSLQRAVWDTMKIIDGSNNHQRLTILVTPDDPPKGAGEDVTVQVIYDTPGISDYFKSEYLRLNATSSYPFASVLGQATARMEVDPEKPNAQCSFYGNKQVASG